MILDEPASGLDPVHQRHVLDLMIDAATNGAAVLFSSHQIGQVERAADAVAIMKNGKLIVNSVHRRFEDRREDRRSGLRRAACPTSTDWTPIRASCASNASARPLRVVTREDSDEIAQRIFALRPKSIRTIDLNLEEIFMNAVSAERV